jgi:hypothetical protein
VGFYRSHTREGLGLSGEDLEMYRRYLPDPWAVALLVKPFATRVSVGALFLREGDDVRHEASYQEFPFRRRELGGDPVKEAEESVEEAAEDRTWAESEGEAAAEAPANDQVPFGLPAARAEGSGPGRSQVRRGWMWIPLSFIFLLFGVLIGSYIAMNLRFNVTSMSREDPYSMQLSAQRSGTSLHLKWNRNAPAIQASSRGLLHINDGGNEKVVELDLLQLQNGSVIYRRATDRVRFRLEVFANNRVSVAESVEYRGE